MVLSISLLVSSATVGRLIDRHHRQTQNFPVSFFLFYISLFASVFPALSVVLLTDDY